MLMVLAEQLLAELQVRVRVRGRGRGIRGRGRVRVSGRVLLPTTSHSMFL